MTDKIGLIKNPLTIIAIFAGIAEVSGTIVLPFISPINQELFIYFLIIFPSALILLFFATLNFNNKVLYAPSDYKDENNYININKYDISQQKSVEIKLPKDNSNKDDLFYLTEKISSISNNVSRLEDMMLKANNTNEENISNEIDPSEYDFLVSNFENADIFINKIKNKGIQFEIYNSPSNFGISSFEEHKAIWLGKDIPLNIAQLVIKQAKSFFPHLRYIKLSEDEDPDHTMLYIGGSTETATKRFNRLPMSTGDFKKLESFKSTEDYHDFIESFKK